MISFNPILNCFIASTVHSSRAICLGIKQEIYPRAGAYLVELQVGVERDVLVERVLLHLGDEVPGHGEEQEAVAEGECGGRAAGDGDAHAHHVAQVEVLGQVRVD